MTQTLYVGTQSDPEQRTKIQISDEDMDVVSSHKGEHGVQFIVRNAETGNDVYLKTDSCGLGACYCAVDFA